MGADASDQFTKSATTQAPMAAHQPTLLAVRASVLLIGHSSVRRHAHTLQATISAKPARPTQRDCVTNAAIPEATTKSTPNTQMPLDVLLTT